MVLEMTQRTLTRIQWTQHVTDHACSGVESNSGTIHYPKRFLRPTFLHIFVFRDITRKRRHGERVKRCVPAWERGHVLLGLRAPGLVQGLHPLLTQLKIPLFEDAQIGTSTDTVPTDMTKEVDPTDLNRNTAPIEVFRDAAHIASRNSPAVPTSSPPAYRPSAGTDGAPVRSSARSTRMGAPASCPATRRRASRRRTPLPA